MSAEQQLAVARTTKGESTHLSKAARQVVPPFLQKLYEIVNDPVNEELIRWSENGDSFYVLNHERFAREVLGRWFKHQKFTSFVRQLNMYGFHKIPHLQQGVLRSDSDTEPWHFEHPHFHRGQPDLLCLIQRKKQPPHGLPDDIQMDAHEPIQVAAPLANLAGGQVLDINSVVNGIAAIKRHQQAISADLNELKTSNQQLWQEALAARERHKKHQDTINRILKFLAGVFGHGAGAGQNKRDGTPESPPRVVIPRKRQRLMIQDVANGKGTEMEEDGEDDESQAYFTRNGSAYPTATSATISTPDITVRSPSVAPSESFSPAISEIPPNTMPNVQTIQPTETISRSSTAEPSRHPSSSDVQSSAIAPTEPSIHSLTTNQGQIDQANMWSAFQQMISSPTSMQKFLQALASQQTYPVANLPDPPHSSAPSTDAPSHPSSNPLATHQVMMYDPNAYDISRFHNNFPAMEMTAGGPMLPVLGSPSRDDSALEPLVHNGDRLQKSYRDASDINAEVDALQMSINSLIEGLGLDPTAIASDNSLHNDTGSGPPKNDSAAPVPPPGTASSSTAATNGPSSNLNGVSTSSSTSAVASELDPIASDPTPEFDFENFFNELSAQHVSGADLQYPDVTSPFVDSSPIGVPIADMPVDGVDEAQQEQLAAFLDEVSSDTTAGDDAIPITATSAAAAQQQAANAKGKKRKSDVAELPTPLVSTLELEPPKVKRKR